MYPRARALRDCRRRGAGCRRRLRRRPRDPRRTQDIATKNGEVESIADGESEGIGVRVLVGGAWGFACDRRLSDSGAKEAAARATEFARASASRTRRPVVLAPVSAEQGEYRTPFERDPIDVPLEEKIELLLRADASLRHADVTITQAAARASREQRAFRSSEGADSSRSSWSAAPESRRSRRRTEPSRSGAIRARTAVRAPRPAGSTSKAWRSTSTVRGSPRRPPRCSRRTLPQKVTTVVIDSEQMQLQVHESVGHPTELDRIYGTEAAYAGTSFLKPDDLGSLRYGSELMNITADSTTPLGLGTFGYDDEGVPAPASRS